MERTICVWFPTWMLGQPDTLPDQPIQAIDETNKVVAYNDLAASGGVMVGMQRRSAEAICPTVVTVNADEQQAMTRFEPVVLSIEALVPSVEVAEPGLAFVPIDGAVRYYGGEAPLVERISTELAEYRHGFRMGLARGPFAAHRAAKATTSAQPILIVDDDAAFLAALDVRTLASEDLAAVLHRLGITTLGSLAKLPTKAIVSRFGREGHEAHRLARGMDRPIEPREIRRDPTISSDFDPPIDHLETAGFAARNLSQRLIAELARSGVAPHRVIVTAMAGDGTVRTRTWRSADPFNDHTLADRIRWQLRTWIEGTGASVRGGLVSLRLEPADLSGAGRQMAIEEDAGSFEEMQRAFMEVQAIAGLDNVLVATPQGGRDARQRVQWTRWGEAPTASERDPDAPWPGQIPGPSPALVPPEPVPFPVTWVDGMPEQVRLKARWVPVLSWAGPWRAVGQWWNGQSTADRYQIVTSVGAYLCEIRDGATYLIGVYD
ncbi:MAG: DNA polymerase Y family protein [Acidimicrobiia bacterium]